MKATKVSALRERGLPADVCRKAEPQADGETIDRHHLNNRPSPINSERKTDTMKSYILREPNTVEPQRARLAERPDPQTDALVQRIVSARNGPALYIGLDVHSESIAVSLAPSDSTEV